MDLFINSSLISTKGQLIIKSIGGVENSGTINQFSIDISRKYNKYRCYYC